MLAVMQHKPEIVRLLLDRGAIRIVADSAGRTPLQQAKQEKPARDCSLAGASRSALR